MIDLDALSRACGAAARPPTPHALGPLFPRVYVITELGPVTKGAILLPAIVGNVEVAQALRRYWWGRR